MAAASLSSRRWWEYCGHVMGRGSVFEREGEKVNRKVRKREERESGEGEREREREGGRER